jgi:acetyl-CoA C-acetyltransferase
MHNRPVVVGIGSIQQKGNFKDLDEALVLMEQATQKAIEDSTNKDVTKYIDEISVPKGFWKYRDPARWIAERNNIEKVKTSITKIGVLQQNLLNTACNKIVNGEISASLIIGGESRYKILRSKIENQKYIETELNINPDNYIKASEDLTLREEEKELGSMAVGYYAILESALRASLKKDLNGHNDDIAHMYSNFSKIAANNIDGWNEQPIDASLIKYQSKKNPLQAFPYNKYHCASWNVNQSCAMIICSETVADKLNIPIKKRVYPLASSETNHMIATLQRPNLIEPIGMKLAADFILDICKKHKLEIDDYDLYSCFPVAIQMFAISLGLKIDNQMTITGGMPFAGGPLNSYVLHSTVKLISKIRERKKGLGIITGVSGMMTKQSYALWSKNPDIDFIHKDFTDDAKNIEKPVEISTDTMGEGEIIGYTIIKKNTHSKAIMYLNISGGKKRKLITSSDESIIRSMEEKEWVGKKVYFKKNQLV